MIDLPRLMLVTNCSLMQPNFESALQTALEGGARFIQLREKDMPRSEYSDLALAAKQLCEEFGANLVLNGFADVAPSIGAAGVHLPESEDVAKARRLLGRDFLIGQSTHSIESARKAEASGADYILFGSVFRTVSHPDGIVAGLDAMQETTQNVAIPVFAIGGITPENSARCREAGAHGVAVIRAVWEAPDVTQAVVELNKAVN